MFSNESERTIKKNYNDFKSENPLVTTVYMKNNQPDFRRQILTS